jgi:hypothetical protein
LFEQGTRRHRIKIHRLTGQAFRSWSAASTCSSTLT